MPADRSFTFVQLSDPHVVSDDATEVRGTFPNRRLARAVAQVAAMTPPPRFVAITGDLIGDDEPASYVALERLLAPLEVPVRFVLGNHDAYPAFASAVLGVSALREERYHQRFDEGGVRFLTLDSRVAGEDGGALSEEELAWLASELEESAPLPVVVLVHHPPWPVGLGSFDDDAIANSERFVEVMRPHAQRVLRVLFGHVHMPIHTARAGLVASSAPSTAYAFTDGLVTPKVCPGPVGYNVIHVDAQGLSVRVTPVVDDDEGASAEVPHG